MISNLVNKVVPFIIGMVLGSLIFALITHIEWANIKGDTWIAFASAVVAGCALFVTVWQTFVTRRHNRLSVRPHLDFGLKTAFGYPIVLNITNKGLGPALITSVSLLHDGKTYEFSKTEVPSTLKTSCEAMGLGQFTQFHVILPGGALSPGDTLALITLTAPPNASQIHNLAVKYIMGIGFSIGYSSIYGEQYTVKTVRPTVNAVQLVNQQP